MKLLPHPGTWVVNDSSFNTDRRCLLLEQLETHTCTLILFWLQGLPPAAV